MANSASGDDNEIAATGRDSPELGRSAGRSAWRCVRLVRPWETDTTRSGEVENAASGGPPVIVYALLVLLDCLLSLITMSFRKGFMRNWFAVEVRYFALLSSSPL